MYVENTNGYNLIDRIASIPFYVIDFFVPLDEVKVSNDSLFSQVMWLSYLLLCGVIMFIMTMWVFLSIGWLLGMFPFWMLGEISAVRGGDTAGSLKRVGGILLYYTFMLPFSYWLFQPAQDIDEYYSSERDEDD